MNTYENTHTHTPGPWVARQIGGSHVSIEKISDGIRSVIAGTCYYKLADEHGGGYEANARLIAAAPDLLEALEDAAFLMRMAAKIAGPMQDSFKRSSEDAAKALAKAEGRA